MESPSGRIRRLVVLRAARTLRDSWGRALTRERTGEC